MMDHNWCVVGGVGVYVFSPVGNCTGGYGRRWQWVCFSTVWEMQSWVWSLLVVIMFCRTMGTTIMNLCVV